MPRKELTTGELPRLGPQGNQALRDTKHLVPKHLLGHDPNKRVFINMVASGSRTGTEWYLVLNGQSSPTRSLFLAIQRLLRVYVPPRNSTHVSVLTSPKTDVSSSVAMNTTDLLAAPLETQLDFVLLAG